jgi:hypothetical protein
MFPDFFPVPATPSRGLAFLSPVGLAQEWESGWVVKSDILNNFFDETNPMR